MWLDATAAGRHPKPFTTRDFRIAKTNAGEDPSPITTLHYVGAAGWLDANSLGVAQPGWYGDARSG